MSRLERILDEMRAERLSPAREDASEYADMLLIRTIRALGGNAGEKAVAEDIIDAYEDVKERHA